MKVFIKNKGEVVLTQNDFVGSGGEGSVYVKIKQRLRYTKMLQT